MAESTFQPQISDKEHRDRWHATYNAALMSVGESDTPEETQECIEFAHTMATRQADRAHGPLNRAINPG
jgi:hypothetical protein